MKLKQTKSYTISQSYDEVQTFFFNLMLQAPTCFKTDYFNAAWQWAQMTAGVFSDEKTMRLSITQTGDLAGALCVDLPNYRLYKGEKVIELRQCGSICTVEVKEYEVI